MKIKGPINYMTYTLSRKEALERFRDFLLSDTEEAHDSIMTMILQGQRGIEEMSPKELAEELENWQLLDTGDHVVKIRG